MKALQFLLVLTTFLVGSNLQPAQAQDTKRIAIVYSETSQDNFFDGFAYSQLFASLQHQAMMAGLPFDLLDEADLVAGVGATGYDALVIPYMPNVRSQDLAAIEATISQAVQGGAGILCSGNLITNNQGGGALSGDPYSRMKQWLGLQYNTSVGPVAATVRADQISHVAMRGYAANELLQTYPQLWFDTFKPITGQTATRLVKLRVGTATHNGVMATVVGNHRNVHFANDQLLADGNLAWSALQWIVYGSSTQIGLKMTRQESIFLSRCDMDQSMFAQGLASTEFPLYDLLAQWKAAYNFVGSYYINVGNNVPAGQYTNWNVSGPLYQDYIAMGNEIGTHSWTHPFYTGQLTPAELDFEFRQSRDEIAAGIGSPIVGVAIPGNPETLAVNEQLDLDFAYTSGRDGVVGSGYPGAFGWLSPDYQMLYFSLDMSPDYTLVEFQGKTPAQAQTLWSQQFQALRKHASQPLVQWMWHDYAPTIQAGVNYTVAMFTNTIAMAAAAGTEFITLKDANDRIRALQAATLTVQETSYVRATVNAAQSGHFALAVNSTQKIARVDGWYAYDEKQVFLPQSGGTFDIYLGSAPLGLTHIDLLPARSNLLSVTGDGTSLQFSLVGKGNVRVRLNPGFGTQLNVTGATSSQRTGNDLILTFSSEGTHNVSITAAAPVNLAPIAQSGSYMTLQDTSVAVTLNASDPNQDSLTYSIVALPLHGTLSGSGANRTYTPSTGFTGNDSFTFRAYDGQLYSNVATISVQVDPLPVGPGVYNPTTGMVVDGNLGDWAGLTSFGLDPADVTGPIDWLETWMAHDANNFYLAYRNDGNVTLSWGYALFADTDGSAATGYTEGGYLPVGSDYLLEDDSIYRYTGNGMTWSWAYVGSMTAAVVANRVELSFPRSLIGNPAMVELFFVGDSSAQGGSTLDFFPDGAVDSGAATRTFLYRTGMSALTQRKRSTIQEW